MKNPWKELEDAIGYRFSRRSWLEAALTHPSFRHENDAVTTDNQRLEFLGDAVLGLAVAAHLYRTCPDLNEGEMTKMRSRLTSTRALAVIASGIGLGKHLRLGRGEVVSGGHLRDSILADALEAVIGAAHLDGGARAIQRIFRVLFIPALHDDVAATWHDNPKGHLQEWTQQQAQGNPQYGVVSQSGPSHAVVFVVEVRIGSIVAGRGEGTSKQAAEVAAAAAALQHLDRIALALKAVQDPVTGC